MIVVEQLNDVLFRIQLSLKAKPIVVHHDKLKPYLGEDKQECLLTGKPKCQVKETTPHLA